MDAPSAKWCFACVRQPPIPRKRTDSHTDIFCEQIYFMKSLSNGGRGQMERLRVSPRQCAQRIDLARPEAVKPTEGTTTQQHP